MNQKILDVAIDWMDGYGNDPAWRVLVNRECDRPFKNYERRPTLGGFMYRAESDLQIDFMHHSGGDKNDGGFGGSTYELRMKGGFDKHVLAGTPEQIEAEVHRLAPLVEDGGYIGFADHRVPPDVPLTNYMHYLHTARRVWGRGVNLKPIGRPEPVRPPEAAVGS